WKGGKRLSPHTTKVACLREPRTMKVQKLELDRKTSNKISSYIIAVLFLIISMLFGTVLDTILRTQSLFTVVFAIFSLLQILFGLSVIEKIIVRLFQKPLSSENIEALQKAQEKLEEAKRHVHIDEDINLVLIDSPSINSLSVGMIKHSRTICITTGAVEKLNCDELKSLIYHELYHIKNGDTDYLTTVSGTFGSPLLIFKLTRSSIRKLKEAKKIGKLEHERYLKEIILMNLILVISAVFLPLSYLSNLFVSTRKEFDADIFAAERTSPDVLIGVFEKTKSNCIQLDTEYHFIRYHFFVHPNCVDTHKKPNSIIDTYPSIEERINNILNTFKKANL
ncbi:M48 family metalloprotease, partial [Fervidobacterium gondwanense]|uniref:M48 family metalloprotease n=2 Tax=Fervidobacterium gondwanense TaxID=44754 RepID=UPI003C761145